MSGETHRPRQEMERVNEAAIEAAKEIAARDCQLIIDTGYATVSACLAADQRLHEKVAEAGYPAGAYQGFLVLRDKSTASRQDGARVQTYSVRLEPKESNTEGKYLRIFIPAEGVRLEEYEMPERKNISRAYAELHEDGDTHWFIIQPDGMDEYIPDLKREEGISFLDDQGIWDWMQERIPESHEQIQKLRNRVINWNVVPQRIDPLPEWHNLDVE